MSKKSKQRRNQPPPRRFPWLWLGMGAALLLIAGGLGIMWMSSTTSSATPANFEPEVAGAPRLSVDQTIIDEGDVKLGTTVRTTFRLKNIGDQPLLITGEPAVGLVEGC
ncbi:hypothetical protein ACFLXQ_00135 [Chloroflexota bacterium]